MFFIIIYKGRCVRVFFSEACLKACFGNITVLCLHLSSGWVGYRRYERYMAIITTIIINMMITTLVIDLFIWRIDMLKEMPKAADRQAFCICFEPQLSKWDIFYIVLWYHYLFIHSTTHSQLNATVSTKTSKSRQFTPHFWGAIFAGSAALGVKGEKSSLPCSGPDPDPPATTVFIKQKSQSLKKQTRWLTSFWNVIIPQALTHPAVAGCNVSV